jgi:hypothetical protein
MPNAQKVALTLPRGAASGLTLLVGVDCASQPQNTGLAFGTQHPAKPERMRVLEMRCASSEAPAAKIVSSWVGAGERVLLALDAPLGWPVALGAALATHQAGWSLPATANEMFRRLTDDHIYKRLRRRPLEVPADRIARAAHSALRFLQELRVEVGARIELVWSPNWHERFGVIEVYPAATRVALGLAKGRGSLAGLEDRLEFDAGAAPASEHERDAAICLIAGAEFLMGRAEAPRLEDMPRVRQEGWIWTSCSAERESE